MTVQLACAYFASGYCGRFQVEKQFDYRACAWGREMRKQVEGFDFHRYRHLLAEAVDEPKRLALIDLLIEERAMDRLEAQRAAERAATAATLLARVLGPSRG